MSSLERKLARLVREPTSESAAAWASEILDQLEAKKKPSAREAELFVEHVHLLSDLGQAERGQKLVRRWRLEARLGRALAKRIELGEAIFAVSADPAAASSRLRELALGDPKSAAIHVTNSVLRGDLNEAIRVAERHRFFPSPVGAVGQSYALWALALSDRLDQAERVLDAIEARREKSPHARLALLRGRASVASYRCQYAREERLLEEALALCHDRGLEHEASFVEVALAAAHARSGDLDAARKKIARWSSSARAQTTALDAYRDLSRMDLAILGEDWKEAERSANRALEYALSTENRMLECHLRFCLALVAPARQVSTRLETFRRLAHRCQVPYYSRRLRVLEELQASGLSVFRAAKLRERARHGSRPLPLSRLWTPPLETAGADLYLNRVLGSVHVRGSGPFFLGEHPVLAALTEVLTRNLAEPIALPDLFSSVWKIAYNPLIHENKCHVTLLRLRRWIALHGGDPRHVEVSEGRAGFSREADVRVIELGEIQVPQSIPLETRVTECLEAGKPLGASELARRIGISRSALDGALKTLIASGQISRVGGGPRTRYAAATRARS